MSSAERQKRCSISALYIQIIKPYLVYKPGLTAVGVRQGKGECIGVLNIPPPPDLSHDRPLQGVIPVYCIHAYTQTGVTLTHDPPPSFWEKIGTEGGN